MCTYECYTTMYCDWIYVIVDVDLPRPPRTLGRKLCGHDSTTPPLDFRSYLDALFD